jgi:magnesium-transporting ATPase (P-type)
VQDRETLTNPYFDPVASIWARIAGIVMLAAAAALTAVLGYGLYDFFAHAGAGQALNSSTLIYALLLIALCGMCWQAGFRLVSRRAGRALTLFSRPAWFAIGTGLLVITALMAAVILKARRPTLVDVQVILSLGGIGVWCLVLAFRRRDGGTRPAPPNGTDDRQWPDR